jgi:hypothetical protein
VAHPPIVVAIEAPNSQTYLNQGNEMLQTLYGRAPVRVNLSSGDGDADVRFHYIYPELRGARHAMLDDHRDLSNNDLEKNLRDGAWLAGQIVGRMRDKIMEKLPETYAYWENDVLIFIVSCELVRHDSHFLEAMQLMGVFPNAVYFEESHTRGTVPTRIVDTATCANCGRKMRAAGSVFVCENCGSVQGAKPIPPRCRVHKISTVHETGNIYRCPEPFCDRTYAEDGTELDGE